VTFLVDESAGQSIASYLRTLGHDVASVQERNPGMEDAGICEWANQEDRIVVTNDKGSGELIFREHRSNRGVVLLRLQDERAVNRIRVVSRLLASYEERIRDQFVVASETRVRIRPSP